jgi:hypothetical protein
MGPKHDLVHLRIVQEIGRIACLDSKIDISGRHFDYCDLGADEFVDAWVERKKVDKGHIAVFVALNRDFFGDGKFALSPSVDT